MADTAAITPTSRSSSFSLEEEAYIIQLREQQPRHLQLSWDDVQQLHSERFNITRSRGALQVHYSRSLQPGKSRRKEIRKRKLLGVHLAKSDSQGQNAASVTAEIPTDSISGTVTPATADEPELAFQSSCHEDPKQNIPTKSSSGEGPRHPNLKICTKRSINASGDSKFDEEVAEIALSGRKRAKARRFYADPGDMLLNEETKSTLPNASGLPHFTPEADDTGLQTLPSKIVARSTILKFSIAGSNSRPTTVDRESSRKPVRNDGVPTAVQENVTSSDKHTGSSSLSSFIGQATTPDWVLVDARTLPDEVPLLFMRLPLTRLLRWSPRTGSIATRKLRDSLGEQPPKFPKQPGPKLPVPPVRIEDVKSTQYLRDQYAMKFRQETGHFLSDFKDHYGATGTIGSSGDRAAPPPPK